MDVNSARTFLAIVDTGNFNRAADLVHVTQSTVSARIKTLEESLGQQLFNRSKSGVTLTNAGNHFVSHAQNIVHSWEQARHDVALPENYQSVIVLGGQFTLWDSLLLKWVPWVQRSLPDIALRTELGSSPELMKMLLDGQIDIAVMYSPQHRTGFEIEELYTDTLELYSTSFKTKNPGEQGYVYIDWGPEFKSAYVESFPTLGPPALAMSHGPMGLNHIVEFGGSGFFPLSSVSEYVENETLFKVSDTPSFTRSVYVVYPSENVADQGFKTGLQGLRYIASLEGKD